MSLDISPDIEAHILAQAQRAGLSVEDYLENLLSESETFAADVGRGEAKSEPPSKEEVRVKIDRGLAQMKRGEYVDGERFMEDLLAGVEDTANTRRTG